MMRKLRHWATLGVTTAALALLTALPQAGAIEGSWIDLFDGESTYGWTVFGHADWEIEDGILKAESGTGGWLATTSEFQDFELKATVKVSAPGTMGLAVRSPLGGHHTENGAGAVILGGEEHDGDWKEIHIRAVGDSIEATVDGETVEIETGNRLGHVAIHYHNYHRFRRPATLEIKEVKLRPLALGSIFNGENLDGWNIIPDRASVFTVEDGEMNIKDGNGQIETDAVYKNFILQMDIISHGEHLNSGVFYRGPKGQFWLGYESQIRNQWMRDDRTRPVDFGTGGIYGVQPSRKVVTSDHEWFTKTIVVNGNHAAVWLDGYQVADYYDHRPVHERGDGKNGFVGEAGTIHLQGHDPATDLSFKNMYLQEYPE